MTDYSASAPIPVELVGGPYDGAWIWVQPGRDRVFFPRFNAAVFSPAVGSVEPPPPPLVYRDSGRVSALGASLFTLEVR